MSSNDNDVKLNRAELDLTRLAGIAYEGYRAHTKGVAIVSGQRIPAWHSMNPGFRKRSRFHNHGHLNRVFRWFRLLSKHKIVFRQWHSYRNKIIPKTAPKAQVQETRRAFYAGAEAMFRIFEDAISGSTERSLAIFEEVKDELARFAEDVLDQRQ